MVSSVLQVGITGGIGSGKSIVSKIFQILKVPVYDADARAKSLMSKDDFLRSQIISLLGREAYDGQLINRSWIAKRVFNDKSLLDQLNSLVHPAVARDYRYWVSTHTDRPMIIKEAALLFETGLDKQLDRVIVVFAPESMRIERVLKRDSHRTRSDVEAIIRNQQAEEEKIAKADFIIANDEKEPVIIQVLEVRQKILAEV